MSPTPFDLRDFSIADSDRLFKEGFSEKDLISLYHFSTPVITNSDNYIESE